MPKRVAYDTAVIALSATTSAAVAVPVNKELRAIVIPSAFTGLAVTFKNSIDEGTTYNDVYDESFTIYTVDVAVSRYIVLNEAVFRGAALIKVVSDTAEAAARSIGLVFSE